MSRNITRNHNIQLLQECGWSQFSNTTVFKKGSLSLLSPSVAENSSGGYWFDIREVNRNRLSLDAQLLIRIVPDLFGYAKLTEINELLSEHLKDNRANSGNVWGIGLCFSVTKKSVDLFNVKDNTSKIRIPLISKQDIEPILK